MTAFTTYRPDYAIPPGDSLKEALDERGMSQAELARRTGRPLKTINEIIRGKAAITPETALQFERVLDVPAEFWNNLEAYYRSDLARLAERQELERQGDWLKLFPLPELRRRKVLSSSHDKATLVGELLRFFGVSSVDVWTQQWSVENARYRRSMALDSRAGATAVWLRLGELRARHVETHPFSSARFRSALQVLRGLTSAAPSVFEPAMKQTCAESGVAIVFVTAITGARCFGATRWLRPDKALIQLSLRYKTDDQLWFTFFHEAGHILLHGKSEVFIEDPEEQNAKEDEANAFAARTLIPDLRPLLASGPLSAARIRGFARDVGVAPGIVVGRLQHDGLLPHSHCNDLKRRFELIEPSGGTP